MPKNMTNPSIMSILEGHFIIAARTWLFTDDRIGQSSQYFTRILRRAGDEGSWLLERVRNNVPDFRNDFIEKMRWILTIITDKEDGPWAHYYRGRALIFAVNVFDGVAILKKSSDAGFLPATSLLGSFPLPYALYTTFSQAKRSIRSVLAFAD